MLESHSGQLDRFRKSAGNLREFESHFQLFVMEDELVGVPAEFAKFLGVQALRVGNAVFLSFYGVWVIW